MPNIDPSSFIKGAAARYNGNRGNLILSVDGLWFTPDDGGRDFHIPIEKIMDSSIEGVVRKRVCVMVNGTNERHLFLVSDYDDWRSSIALAAGIYRRVVSGSRSSQAAVQPPAPKQSPPPAQPQSPQVQQAPPKAPAPRKKKAAPQAQAPTPQKKSPAPAASTPTVSRTLSTAQYNGPWPSGQDYEQSFQTMSISLNPALGKTTQWEASKNPKTPGWYVYASGNYGSIYRVKDENDKYFALKCFTRKSANLNERYLKISDYLSSSASGINFLAHFRYYQEGIRTRKSQSYYFPVLKMEWMDGITLNKYIQANIDNPKILKKISLNLISEIDKLQNAGISHGDLAGDNIIVTPGGEVKLVDYDGMFIPEFKGQRSSEMGHADFQHPDRTADSFTSRLDNFSALVIHLSLSVLSEKPELWERFNGNDPDCLILRKKDFLNLDVSPVFSEISSIRNRKIRKMSGLLKEYLTHGPLWDGANPSTLLSL